MSIIRLCDLELSAMIHKSLLQTYLDHRGNVMAFESWQWKSGTTAVFPNNGVEHSGDLAGGLQ